MIFYLIMHQIPLIVIPPIYCMKVKKQEGKSDEGCK